MLCLCELIYFSLGKNTQHNWIFLFYFFLNTGLAWCNFQCCIIKVIFWENIAFHGIPFLGPSREACEWDPALCAEEAWESLKWTGLSGAAVAVWCNVLLQCPPHVIIQLFVLEGTLKIIYFQSLCRNTFHWTSAQSLIHLALNASKDGALSPAQGNLLQCLTSLTAKNYFLIFNLNPLP